MGAILEARCPCGYAETSAEGMGMSGGHPAMPALCAVCAQVVTVDSTDELAACPRCMSEVITYDRWQVQEVEESSIIGREGDGGFGDPPTLTSPGIRYLCPACREPTMSFERIGSFD